MTKLITKLVAILFIVTIQAQQKPVTKLITETLGNQYNMTSSVLKEERTLLIHIPKSYAKSDKKFPVIYVLDGSNHFNHAINAATLLSENGRMPASIIVAIPNNRGTRGRDLGHGRDNFKKYIKEEVIPFVNRNYRTSNHKTIFGHSMAGAFVLNYLATEASLFDNYIAASPVVQIFNSELLEKFSTLLKENKTLSKPLYFTLTGAEAEGQRATDALNKFVALLKKEAPKSFRWKYDFIENQIHMTTPYLTMYKGFTEVFYDFQSPSYSSFKDYTDRGGMQQLKKYYAKRAAKYNTENVIAENTMRRLANVMLADKQETLAVNLLVLNTKNHPTSMGALNSLARVYMRLKQTENAKKTYQAAVNLAEKQGSPNSAYFKRQLQNLENN
jgi:predicted alpha/beta superfamily hydrolase